MPETPTALAPLQPDPGPLPREVVKLIARDIASAVAHHIATMYPQAVEATSPNMLVSVRGCAINEIMAALETTDVDEIAARLKRRAAERRGISKMYNAIRRQSAGGAA